MRLVLYRLNQFKHRLSDCHVEEQDNQIPEFSNSVEDKMLVLLGADCWVSFAGFPLSHHFHLV